MKFPERQAELGAVDAIEVEQIANAQSSLPIKYDGNGNPLEPQPSADPHDPLNLPSWQKWPLMAVLAYWSFIGTMNLIIVGPSFFELAENYHVSFTALAYTINGPLLAYGFGCLFWVPFSNVWGIRVSFLVATLGAAGFSIWAAVAPSFEEFVAARVLSSFFYSSPEALGPQIVADVFYLHQRATVTGIFTFFQFVGFSIAGLIGGFATLNLGWRAPSWIMVGLTFGAFIAIFFLLPETTYTRAGHFKPGEKRRIIDSLRLWSASGGGNSKVKKPLNAFKYPWFYAVHPIVICNTIFFSLVLATNDYMLTTSSTSFTFQYNFSLSDVALTSIAPTIGTCLGIIYGGVCNDKYVSWQRKRAGGTFVPEMRLPMLILTAVFGPAGLIMFGCATQSRTHWIVPLFGELLMSFTIVVDGNIMYAYLVDTYLERADTALVLLNGLKNLSAFALVYSTNPWNTSSGYAISFGCLAVIVFVCHLPMLLLYVKGRSIREWQLSKFVSARSKAHGEGFN
ncbi:hypothetical protein LTR67_005340 [Exophiala xenobiotica]